MRTFCFEINEETVRAVRSHTSKKDTQYNGKKKRDSLKDNH